MQSCEICGMVGDEVVADQSIRARRLALGKATTVKEINKAHLLFIRLVLHFVLFRIPLKKHTVSGTGHVTMTEQNSVTVSKWFDE